MKLPFVSRKKYDRMMETMFTRQFDAVYESNTQKIRTDTAEKNLAFCNERVTRRDKEIAELKAKEPTNA